jgi:ADP-dependent NAD(P)H-hydrate dehydratase / NAD(P)H-hydrate epimerase
MRVLTSEAMREVDRRAVDQLGIPSLVLMENAALGVADALGRELPDASSAALFCGPGNNGGDGLALARHLTIRGYRVETFLTHGGRSLSGDAKRQLGICRAMGLEAVEIGDREGLEAAVAAAGRCDVLVDALFGTGLGRPLEGFFAAAVEGINSVPRPVVAVDLPSGLDASSPQPPGPHVAADLTVTFAAPKVAHVLPPAAASVGELVVVDLGIPNCLIEEASGGLRLLLGDALAASLTLRRPEAHKGDFGHLLLVAGGPGTAGAVVLAARAAVRAGTGLVTAAVPAPLASTVDLGSLESMTLALASDSEGRLSGAAVEQVAKAAAGKTAVAMGPGTGAQGETGETLRRIALDLELPMLLDADAINAFADRVSELRRRSAATVLTPHPGELRRLMGWRREKVMEDRLGAALEAAEATGAVMVLKGHRTLVASPHGEVGICPTGNPGMATGGTGDVLTGVIGGLLAQGIDPWDAAAIGVYVHGLAGDLAATGAGEIGLAASDLLNCLGGAFIDLQRAGSR